MEKLEATCYVDGSFNHRTGYTGSAVLLFIKADNPPHRHAYKKPCKSLLKYGSNIAEINAVMTAVKAAHSLGVTDLTICYDWNGLEIFSYKSNIKSRHKSCPIFAQYADFMEKKRMNMRISFFKVKAHSGDEPNNDKVHKMAKVAAAESRM